MSTPARVAPQSTATTTEETEAPTTTGPGPVSHRWTQTGLLLALPCAVIVLSFIVWIVAVSRSGFWADDFLNVTHFAGTLGNLTETHIDAGQYTINIFWAIGTDAFGSGSAAPFLILNSLVLATGVVMWLWTGTNRSWSLVYAWWIGGLFVATAAWLPTALWASNITHSGGFLALGAGMVAHNRAMRASTARAGICWSIASGIAWTFAIISNLLYIGLMVIAVYCAWHQICKLKRLAMDTPVAAVTVLFWNLLLPILFFVTVAYPARTAKAAYAKPGLQFVRDNLRYYRTALAPTDLLTAVYAALVVGAIMGAFAAARRRKDIFPLAILAASAGTALPALVQSQQREVHYMAMPLLLVFSALMAGAYSARLVRSKRIKGAALIIVTVTLLLIFKQGSALRAYFVQSPYGSSLTAFRSEVASLTKEGETVCARLDLDASQEALLIAQMSGENGFHVPPINAGQVYLLPGTQSCPSTEAAKITIDQNARGDFVASG